MNDQWLQAFLDSWGQATLLWQRLRRPVLEKENLTQTDRRILYSLFRLKSASKKELAVDIVLEHSSLTRALARLENRELIAREACGEDKRCVKLNLTAKGLALTKKIKKQSLALAQQVFANVNEQQLIQFKNTFETMEISIRALLTTKTEEK